MALKSIPSIAPKTSIGKPTGATNLILNGGVETNATGWGLAGGGTVSQARTASTAMYGDYVLRVTCTNDSQNQGTYFGDNGASKVSVTAESTYTGALDILRVSGSGTINLRLAWYDAADGFISSTDSAEFAVPASRTRVTITGTAPALTDHVRLIANRTTGNTGVVTFDVDGAQVEAGAVATPYIHTDGTTGTRNPNKWVG